MNDFKSGLADFRSNSLIAVLSQYNLTLPRNAHEWRVPSEPQSGYISGITNTSVKLLCTDGILGWFTWDDGTVILGHMQYWEPSIEPKVRTAGASRKSKVNRLIEED